MPWGRAGHLALFLALSLGGALPAAAEVPLATYRVVHDLVLDKSIATGDLLDVSARIVTEFTGSACTGYTDQTRFVMKATERDGTQRTSDLRQTMVETMGGRLSFDEVAYGDGRLAEQSVGAATRGEDNGVAVSLKRPKAKTFMLPAAVVFPTELTRKTIAAANAGKRFLALDLYSGDADGETVYATAITIGPKSVAPDFGEDAPIGQSDFATMPHWPVTISYFEKNTGSADSEPLYASSYVLYENGIVSHVRFRYSDFSLVGTLTSYQALPAAPCP